MTSSPPTLANPSAAELEQLRDDLASARGDAEANRVLAGQHPGLLDKIHKLEEELFDERLAFGRLKALHDSIDAIIEHAGAVELKRIQSRTDLPPDVVKEIAREAQAVVNNVRQEIMCREAT